MPDEKGRKKPNKAVLLYWREIYSLVKLPLA
jgi:hypothetical protein